MQVLAIATSTVAMVMPVTTMTRAWITSAARLVMRRRSAVSTLKWLCSPQAKSCPTRAPLAGLLNGLRLVHVRHVTPMANPFARRTNATKRPAVAPPAAPLRAPLTRATKNSPHGRLFCEISAFCTLPPKFRAKFRRIFFALALHWHAKFTRNCWPK
jgi:hypothetical protein